MLFMLENVMPILEQLYQQMDQLILHHGEEVISVSNVTQQMLQLEKQEQLAQPELLLVVIVNVEKELTFKMYAQLLLLF